MVNLCVMVNQLVYSDVSMLISNMNIGIQPKLETIKLQSYNHLTKVTIIQGFWWKYSLNWRQLNFKVITI